MQVPVEWLKDYINTDKDAKTLAKLLTSTGSEAEGLESFSQKTKNLVVGRIESIEKHPEADRLSICQINVGKMVQIVTGASNIKEGDYVPVALAGSVLPNGLKINVQRLRGIESEGMLFISLSYWSTPLINRTLFF